MSKIKAIIRCKEDLYNRGKCFTKGKEYEVNTNRLHNEASLINTKVINDLGEKHIIGMWWRKFKIIKIK